MALPQRPILKSNSNRHVRSERSELASRPNEQETFRHVNSAARYVVSDYVDCECFACLSLQMLNGYQECKYKN